jgi:hypothetical protein
MDELPKNAQEILALAREAHQPPPEARERVRAAVAVAIAAGGIATASTASSAAAASGGAGTSAVKAGLFAGATGKLLIAGGVVAAIGAGTVAVRQMQRAPAIETSASTQAHPHPRTIATPSTKTPVSPQATTDTPANALTPTAADLPATNAQVPREARANAATTRGPKVLHRKEPATGDLGAEMTLLANAERALERGDVAAAHAALEQHRQKFEHGQLREERKGLEVLARCVSHEPKAAERARAYLKAAPEGVLAARIEAACGLKEAP